MRTLIIALVVLGVMACGLTYGQTATQAIVAGKVIIKTEKEVAIDALARMKLTDVQKRAAEKSIRDLDWSGGTAAAWDRCYLEIEKILSPADCTAFRAAVDSLHKSLKPAPAK